MSLNLKTVLLIPYLACGSSCSEKQAAPGSTVSEKELFGQRLSTLATVLEGEEVDLSEPYGVHDPEADAFGQPTFGLRARGGSNPVSASSVTKLTDLQKKASGDPALVPSWGAGKREFILNGEKGDFIGVLVFEQEGDSFLIGFIDRYTPVKHEKSERLYLCHLAKNQADAERVEVTKEEFEKLLEDFSK